ncbi:hypothetical protein pdam_00007815 [Pocillopora damicornis]|uniref:Uncharacterized protein n=1 Tax=Pocillopora damicornis TaxID=46731 RepID=A0A3M6TY26_POCDA|nr:hypothetical protein pdam_00007815 [Pocillopora damicornis]
MSLDKELTHCKNSLPFFPRAMGKNLQSITNWACQQDYELDVSIADKVLARPNFNPSTTRDGEKFIIFIKRWAMKASGHEQRIEKTEEKREILTTGFLNKLKKKTLLPESANI